MSYKKTAFEFIEDIWENEKVLQVVLFGSVARGDSTRDSDIDLFVIVKDKEETDNLERIASRISDKLELTVSEPDLSDYDESFISDVFGEGIILFSRKKSLEVEGIELEPKALVTFSLKNLEQSEKTKVNRALYGRKTKSKYKGKEYVSEKKGIVPEEGKLGSGTVLVDKNEFKDLRKSFERFGVKFKKYDIWL